VRLAADGAVVMFCLFDPLLSIAAITVTGNPGRMGPVMGRPISLMEL